MKNKSIRLGLLAICISAMLILPLVYADQGEPAPVQNGEDSDGDHDRLQDRSHPNADVMNGVGGYGDNDPGRNGIGSG